MTFSLPVLRLFRVAFFLLLTSGCFAQSFQPGYIVENNGTKIPCLIENLDWRYNPSSITVKANTGDDPLIVGMDSISGFSVGDYRYFKAHVRYDGSSQNLHQLSTFRHPLWVEDTLLLRVIVDGDVDLYRYHTQEFSLFFFRNRQQPIEQLVHKYYYARDPEDTSAFTKRRIANLTYLEQLRQELPCSTITSVNESTTPYRLRQLTSYFRKYNQCIGAKYEDHTRQGSLVSIRLRPGLDLSSINASDRFGTTIVFPNTTSLRGGVEIELVLPLPKNLWTFVIEPTYQSYSAPEPYRLRYKSIEVPMAVRRYIPVSESTRLFVNPILVPDFPLVYEMDFSRTITLDVASFRVNFGVGAGINLGKLSLEGRVHTARRGSDNQTQSIAFEFRKTSVIFGYKIL